MSANYRADRILVKASELQQGDVDRLNKIMENAGHGRPLGPPETGIPAAGASGLVQLTVTGADPMAIRDAARAHAQRNGEELPTLMLDHQHTAGTAEQGARDTELFAAGLKSGHGTVAWLPAPRYEMPDGEPWRQLDRRPVIALLDSGVRPHRWLPDVTGAQDFVVDAAEAYGWAPPKLPADDAPFYGSHLGHATFIAGLIRMAAPDAQILSMRVMDSTGQVSTGDVSNALTWLVDHPQVSGSVDIVLTAFGRRADPDDHDPKLLHDRIDELGRNGVRFVASAGNDGSERPVYPAAFAAVPALHVTSVGGLISPTERAPGSNFGPWVREWRNGFNIVSIMPLTTRVIGDIEEDPTLGFGPFSEATGEGYAWWTGTSFAAAIYAGELAAQLPQPGPALPEPATGP